MREIIGRCRWCGCSHFYPCPGGCGWANARQTLCTACVNVDREWEKNPRPPNMWRAFFRGYMVGSNDQRAEGRDNPYVKPERASRPLSSFAQVWDYGRQAGRAEA